MSRPTETLGGVQWNPRDQCDHSEKGEFVPAMSAMSQDLGPAGGLDMAQDMSRYLARPKILCRYCMSPGLKQAHAHLRICIGSLGNSDIGGTCLTQQLAS